MLSPIYEELNPIVQYMEMHDDKKMEIKKPRALSCVPVI
jgi:hypothetical protein